MKKLDVEMRSNIGGQVVPLRRIIQMGSCSPKNKFLKSEVPNVE